MWKRQFRPEAGGGLGLVALAMRGAKTVQYVHIATVESDL